MARASQCRREKLAPAVDALAELVWDDSSTPAAAARLQRIVDRWG
jgi:hypothetical protein